MAKYNPYDSLAADEVLAVLFGGRDFGEYEDEEKDFVFRVGLKRLSRDEVRNLCRRFRMSEQDILGKLPYDNLDMISPEEVPAEVYCKILMEHCIETGSCPALLALLFDGDQFRCLRCGDESVADDETYAVIVNRIIDGINRELRCSGTEMALTENGFVVRDRETEFSPLSTKFETANEDVRKRKESAITALANGEYDQAVMLAGTILEATVSHAMLLNGIVPDNKAGLFKKFEQFKKNIRLDGDPARDGRIKDILDAAFSPLGKSRNNDSPAHDAGVCFPPDEDYARLCVNMAISTAEYVMSMLPVMSVITVV